MDNLQIVGNYLKIVNKINNDIDNINKINEDDLNQLINILKDIVNTKQIKTLLYDDNYINILNFTRRRNKKYYDKIMKVFSVLNSKERKFKIENIDDLLYYNLRKIINGVFTYEECILILKEYLNEDSFASKTLLNSYLYNVERTNSQKLLRYCFEDYGTYMIDKISREYLDETSQIELSQLKKYYVIVKKLDENVLGLNYDKKQRISISEYSLNRLNYYDIDIIETLFHEITHACQLLSIRRDMNTDIFNIDNLMKKNGYISKKEVNFSSFSNDFKYIDYVHYIMKKESIMQEKYKNYYKDNYDIVHFELDARYNAIKLLKNIVNELELKYVYINNTKIDLNVVEKHLYDKLMNNKKIVKYDGKKIEINELFDKLVNEKFLNNYSIFLIEYNKDGTKKSKEQLQKDYNEKKNSTNEKKLLDRIDNLYKNLV